MMKLRSQFGESTVSFARFRDDGFLVAEVDGESYSYEARRCGENIVQVKMGNGQLRAHVFRNGKDLWVALGEHCFFFQEIDEGRAASESKGALTSPMPGRVLEIRVKPGDQVSKGETLLVVEAMKMEVPIVSPHDGVVKEIATSVEARIDAGAVLVSVEANSESE